MPDFEQKADTWLSSRAKVVSAIVAVAFTAAGFAWRVNALDDRVDKLESGKASVQDIVELKQDVKEVKENTEWTEKNLYNLLIQFNVKPVYPQTE